MPNKLLRFAFIFALLFGEFGRCAFYAQGLPVAAPSAIPDDIQTIMPPPSAPEGSALAGDNTVFAVPQPPAAPQQAAQPSPVAEAALQRDMEQERQQDYFGDRQSRAGFKLFEPSRYEFLQDDAPLLLPQPEGEEEDWDNYYRYSRKYLDNIIAQAGGGIELREKSIEYLEILNPSLLVPIYGTTISLTGRKTFGLKYTSKKYKGKQTVNSRDFSGVDFEQEMQVKLQGKISDRIFVDIDYDDQRSDAQNISVAYRGKGEEFVQSADFGDIELRLPDTEFLSYNKQVFGAQMHLKYAGANLRLIGSQTKGERKNKQFKGSSVFDTVNIKDTQYIRRRYYDLTFDKDTDWNYAIVSGSEKIYLDDHTSQGYQVAMQAQDLKQPSSVYPPGGGMAAFRLLTRGVDYVIDYNRGTLVFNAPLKDTDVIAADFQSTNGGRWLRDGGPAPPPGTLPIPKIIKTSSDRPLNASAEIGYNLEIKRYYDIGSKQITHDNGQGNFILKLLESDGRETCTASPAPDYCKFIVDYDKGIFEIFGPFPDPGIYAATQSSAANRFFFVQFSSSVRTYFLEPDIVVQSETVKINGATMARNRDYYVDYASGFITFYKEELIGPNSVIDAVYETVAGGSAQSTLLGGRFNYDFTRNISIGASVLNESNAAPKRVPNVGALSSSLTVMEADFKARDIEVAEGVKISAGVEAAQSKKDENLFGYAMIDNFEETKEYVKASMAFSDWVISSNPNGNTSFFDAIKWDTEEIKVLDINPAGAARADAKQNVLTIHYDFSVADNAGYAANDEVSIVFPISAQGADFTQKTLFELTMQGEVNGPDINISFGTVDERSDIYKPIPAGYTEAEIFPACSKYYAPGQFYVPKTEDLRCTGLLTPAEDIGWLFVNPDGTAVRYDPFRDNKFNKMPQPNGRIDTQDLNGNGIYDYEDTSAGGNFGFNAAAYGPGTGAGINGLDNGGRTINYTGWKQFQQEVDFSDSLRWGSIRQMRITFKKNGGKSSGTIKIANLSVSGSTWQTMDSTSGGAAFYTYGVNNIDNPVTYKPIFNDNGDGGRVFRDLYGSVNEIRSGDGTNNVKEQALALVYDFSSPQTDFNVQRNFSKMDFSQHKEYRFLLYNKNTSPDPNTSFYIRVSSDEHNYSEAAVPLDFVNEWRLYTLKLIDTNGDGIPERWEDISGYPGVAVDNEGYLNFKRISTIKTGVRADAAASGEVWLDEVHLADSVITQGNAYMGEAKIDVDGWFEAGGKYTYTDANFQTPLAVPSKQQNTREDYYLKFKRIKHLPITANYRRSGTVTPDVLDYDKSNTVSLLDAGEVKRSGGDVRADYNAPAAPRVGLEYAFENADYQKLQRSDERDYYAANIDYSPAGAESFFKNIAAGAALAKNRINYNDAVSMGAPASYYDTDEKTQSYNFKLALQPWRGASLMPSYSLSMADEKRRYFDGSAFKDRHYDKSASQSAGVSAAVRIANWLAPTAAYNVTTRENNNLSPVSYRALNQDYYFDIGEVKSVNRMSDGNISLTLNGKEILPRAKLFAGFTVSGSYKIQDGDAWENVDNSFNSLDDLWLRSSMGLKAPYTYRSKLTLRDTYTSALRWTPFQQYSFAGAMAPLKTLSVINNFTKSYQTTEDLGSAYQSTTSTLPDIVVFIDELEKTFRTGGFMTGTNLKLKYNLTKTETLGADYKEDASYGGDLRFVLFNYFDNTFSYSQQTLDKTDTRAGAPLENYLRRDLSAQTSFNYKRLRLTPKFTYLFDTRTQAGDVLVNDVQEMVPSLNIRADFNLPFGLKLPFITRRYLVTNRIIWNTNISYSRRRSFTVAENRDLFDVNTNFDYEISKNMRLTISGAFQNFKHLYIEEESYTAYNIGTLMTIQF